jgi:eukaryotic-like serine/threonine-protein kinase
VWRARDTLLDRIVAVKLLRPEYAGSLEFRDRLRWEGRHAGLLSHPGVVQVHDYDDPATAPTDQEGGPAVCQGMAVLAVIRPGFDRREPVGVLTEPLRLMAGVPTATL